MGRARLGGGVGGVWGGFGGGLGGWGVRSTLPDSVTVNARELYSSCSFWSRGLLNIISSWSMWSRLSLKPAVSVLQDNVQSRLHPFPQSLHVPTMITSRSDPIHSRRASKCQSWERLDQTPSVPGEHPCANHDNVQIRPHPFPQSIRVPTMITSRSDSIHSRRAPMCQP